MQANDPLETSVRAIYKKYGKESKNPRCHPIVQHVGNELRLAKNENRAPDWDKITASIVQQSCSDMAARHPDWHGDLNSGDLGAYISDLPPRKMWWIAAGQPALEAEEDSAYGLSMQCRSHVLIANSSYG